jgi:superfamily I DNA/RNA helicase
VRVAFFLIQKTTDLFGADFPDFTSIATSLIADSHPLAALPRMYVASGTARSIGKSVLKRYREMRKAGLENVGVICHADQYWDSLESELRGASVPLHVMLQRGERTAGFEPHIVLSKPAFVGGQEFDGVIVVGLEQGVMPPRVRGNDALAVAVEQQALRETYVSVTRARYRLIFMLSADAAPNDALAAAESAGLIVRESS